ncbi:MAG: HlyD family efflux transporter periplasmic adaptor subunit [Leptolyngbyaceae cyanobacterium MO_188.B28]|nr:HlyD family efflux transporter periplasmic adaptor subunit [Leptolyngbyaceae cyanobacterium MO_188.B28]
MTDTLHPKPLSRYWKTGATALLIVCSVSAYLVLSPAHDQGPAQETVVDVAPARAVTALGRLEPQGEVIKLSTPNAADSRVNQLLVKEGDWVDADEVIAILQGLDKKQAELMEAQRNVAVYQARLAQIEAGDAKVAEIAAQQAVINQLEAQLRTETAERKAAIARAQAELRNAEQNYRRYEQLHQRGAIETLELDDRRKVFEMAQATSNEAEAHLENTVLTLQERIQQERSLLDKLREVRPVDLQASQAELDHAIAHVNRIEAELEDIYVRVPIAGQILKINTHIGEQVNINQGIVELGRTNQMYAIAEVYETDVGLVQPGQRATVISEHGGFEGEIHGEVDHVGMQIKKQDVLDADPAADKDARVVEVKVRIDPEDNDKIASLTNLQVRITIDLERREGQP